MTMLSYYVGDKAMTPSEIDLDAEEPGELIDSKIGGALNETLASRKGDLTNEETEDTSTPTNHSAPTVKLRLPKTLA